MANPGPIERETRKRLLEATLQGDEWDKIRAAGRAANGGGKPEVDLNLVLIGLIDAGAAVEQILFRLAAEIDRLNGHDAPRQ